MTREQIDRDMELVRQADGGAVRVSASVIDDARRRLRAAGFDKISTAAEHEDVNARMGVTDGPTAPYWVRCTRVFPVGVTKAAAQAFLASSANERARVWPPASKAKAK